MNAFSYYPVQGNRHAAIRLYIWLHSAVAVQAVPSTVEVLPEGDPGNATAYSDNGAAFVTSLESLHDEPEAILAPVASEAFLPFHDVWPCSKSRRELHFGVIPKSCPGSVAESAGVAPYMLDPERAWSARG